MKHVYVPVCYDWESSQAAFEAQARKALLESNGLGFFSCSENRDARSFGAFVNRWAYGSILDVGCGMLAKPVYLDGIESERITGIDPIEVEHPFRFVKTTIEDFKFERFDTVICGTVLDHVSDISLAVSKVRQSAFRRIIVWQADEMDEGLESLHTYRLSHDALLYLFRGCPLIEKHGDFFCFQP